MGSPPTLEEHGSVVFCVGYYATADKKPSVQLWATTNSSNLSLALVRCRPTKACQGGPQSHCHEGYSGLRCGHCSDGWYMLGQECEQCGADSVPIGLAVLLAILAAVLILFFLWQVALDPRIGSPLVFAMKLAEVRNCQCKCRNATRHASACTRVCASVRCGIEQGVCV